MKKLTQCILPRYTWFMLWFMQWFKNPDGIKAFADQVMNWLMQETMGLSTKLKKQNKYLDEKNKQYERTLEKCYQHPTVEADEYDEIRSKVRKLGFWVTFVVVGEAALNFFAVKSIINGEGWAYLILQIISAVIITGASIYLFERFFAIILNKPRYKQEQAKKRNLIEILLVFLLCVAYEFLIYYLCKYRCIILEGGSANSFLTNFVILSGTVLPLVVGLLAYDRNIVLTPYKNTLRIAKLEKRMANCTNKIAVNLQRMEDHFKKCCEDKWAFHQEFRCYKDNYNIKNAIPEELVECHFSESPQHFVKEAICRFKKNALHNEAAKPVVNTASITNNTINQDIKELFA
jgi:hypothetical protein